MKKNAHKLYESLSILKRERAALDHLELPKQVIKNVSDDLFTAMTSLDALISKIGAELEQAKEEV